MHRTTAAEHIWYHIFYNELISSVLVILLCITIISLFLKYSGYIIPNKTMRSWMKINLELSSKRWKSFWKSLMLKNRALFPEKYACKCSYELMKTQDEKETLMLIKKSFNRATCSLHLTSKKFLHYRLTNKNMMTLFRKWRKKRVWNGFENDWLCLWKTFLIVLVTRLMWKRLNSVWRIFRCRLKRWLIVPFVRQ